MDNNYYTECDTQANQEKTLVGGRMLGIGKQNRRFIRERGLGLLEGDAMLGNVGSRLRGVPNEMEIGHRSMYIQRTWIVHHGVCAA